MAKRLYENWEVRQVAVLVSARAFNDELLKDIDREIVSLDLPSKEESNQEKDNA